MTSTADALPELVGNYRIVAKLGEGGMGTVYSGEHALLGRRAAIKVLREQYTTQQAIVDRFFNEARAATSIADPGIVQIFDFGYEDDVAFIVMELLEGEPLDVRLKRLGRLPVSDVLRLCRQLSLSLYAAHQRGVIHRDLKPENVFIVQDPEVAGGERTKILDFGIAKLVDTEQSRVKTQTGVMMGTPLYMSPEQCRGAGEVDHRSDIYSLGCVLFHLLAGRPPFEEEGAGLLIAAHLREPAPPPSRFVPDLPPAIDAIVLRCLAKDPAERLSTMRELAVELDGALRSLALPSSVDTSRLTPLPGSIALAQTVASTTAVRRRPRYLFAIGAVVLVAAGGAAAFAVVTSSSSPAARSAPTAPVSVPTETAPAPAPAAVPVAPVPAPAVASPSPTPPPPAAPTPTEPPAPVEQAPAEAAHAPIVKATKRLHAGKTKPVKPAPTAPQVAPPPAQSAKPPADPYDDR